MYAILNVKVQKRTLAALIGRRIVRPCLESQCTPKYVGVFRNLRVSCLTKWQFGRGLYVWGRDTCLPNLPRGLLRLDLYLSNVGLVSPLIYNIWASIMRITHFLILVRYGYLRILFLNSISFGFMYHARTFAWVGRVENRFLYLGITPFTPINASTTIW